MVRLKYGGNIIEIWPTAEIKLKYVGNRNVVENPESTTVEG